MNARERPDRMDGKVFMLSILQYYYMKSNPIKLPKYMQDDEIKAMMERCSNRRDRLIIKLMMTCGMRVSEVIGITPEDIDIRNRTVRVHGKGSKDRTAYPSHNLLLDLHDFIADNGIQRQSKIFPITRQTVFKIIKRLSNGRSPHKLRHTFAVNYLESGGDLRTLQRILGHSDLKTTSIYLDILDTTVQEASDKFNKFFEGKF